MMKLNHQPSIMNGPGGILMKKALTTLFGLVFLTGQLVQQANNMTGYHLK